MNLAETLRRALSQRQEGLAARVADLRGAIVDPGSALSDVLELVAFFPDALGEVVSEEWVRNPSEISRLQLLRPLLRHAIDVTSFVDEWLAQAAGTTVPFHLLAGLERECVELDLDSRRAIVAGGAADNFITMVREIDSALFDNLGPLCPPRHIEIVKPFVVMQAARKELMSPRFQPLILGHELAHIVVMVKNLLDQLDIGSGLDVVKARTIDVPGVAAPGPAGVLRLTEIAESWAEELVCDAFAVRRFGVAAVAALGEFLDSVGAIDVASETHPPGRLRLHMLVGWLGAVGDPRLAAIVEPWLQVTTQPVIHHEDWAQFLMDSMIDRTADLWATAEGIGGDGYSHDARAPIIHAATAAINVGMPPEPTLEVATGRVGVSDQDIISAAWLAYVEGVANPVDRLASKSLADLEFLRRWSAAGGAWSIYWSSSGQAGSEDATLSADQICGRMQASGSSRLVVTPLLPDFASGASLDLRLGNAFIVFVRSRVGAFDPLTRARDPRQMQRHMQLAWGERFVLHPGELVLAATLEYLVMPSDLSAQVLSRSSYGRLGLLSATAVQVHPNFHGCLTLELVNLGTVPLVLTPGERIAQLVFSPTGVAALAPEPKYHCPIGPEFSKVRTDPEVEILLNSGTLPRSW